jgi:hypothetical protein
MLELWMEPLQKDTQVAALSQHNQLKIRSTIDEDDY